MSYKLDLKCPRDWESLIPNSPFNQILLECWYWVAAKHLPNGVHEACVLYDDESCSFLSEPLDAEDMMFPVDVTSLNENSNLHKENIRAEYKELTDRFVDLSIQRKLDRPKHYAPPDSTEDEMLEISIRKKGDGILIPQLTEEVQRLIMWKVMSEMFVDAREELERSTGLSDEADFWEIWGKLAGHHHVKLYVDLIDKVGTSSGEWVSWLCFDFSYNGKTVHCYPVPDSYIAPTDLTACFDELQGLFNSFKCGTQVEWTI